MKLKSCCLSSDSDDESSEGCCFSSSSNDKISDTRTYAAITLSSSKKTSMEKKSMIATLKQQLERVQTTIKIYVTGIEIAPKFVEESVKETFFMSVDNQFKQALQTCLKIHTQEDKKEAGVILDKFSDDISKIIPDDQSNPAIVELNDHLKDLLKTCTS
jgi:hypothetical protein